MSSRIRPVTRDPAEMMREGWHEPERVFRPPPVSVLSGKLEDRAFEMLELMVWVYRISDHDTITGRGISWALVQRWHNVGGSRQMRNRIYAALAFLVHEGYLREGPPAQMPPPGLASDFYVPTEKAFVYVDERQAGIFVRMRNLLELHRLPSVIVSSVLVALITSALAYLLGLF